MPSSLEHPLAEAYRNLEDGLPESWCTFGALLRRNPEGLRKFSKELLLKRLLRVLKANPFKTGAEFVLELFLPLRIDTAFGVHPETGLPLQVQLLPEELWLRATRNGLAWEATEPIGPAVQKEVLERDLFQEPFHGRKRALQWYNATEYVQRLTDRARANETLAPGWEIRLPHFSRKKHLFPQEDLRVMLAPQRRKIPSPLALSSSLAYRAEDSASFYWWFYFPNPGEFYSLVGAAPQRDLNHHEILQGRNCNKGSYTKEGRYLSLKVKLLRGSIEWNGFLDDQGRLCLRSFSHITSHQNAYRARSIRSPQTPESP